MCSTRSNHSWEQELIIMSDVNIQPLRPNCLAEQVTALLIEGVLTSGHPLLSTQSLQKYNIAVQNVEAERSFLAFRIPYLPYQIDATGLVGQTDKEKISEIIKNQTILLANLSKWVGTSFSLRYYYQPDKGSIGITLLARVIAKREFTNSLSLEITEDVTRHLKSMRIPVEVIHSEQEIRDILVPLPQPFIAEIWPHEHLTQIPVIGSFEEIIAVDTSVLCPYQQPKNATWRNVLDIIISQTVPVVLNIHIEPTTLFGFEEYLLENNARAAESVSSYRITRNTYQREIKDPIATTVARSYSKRWKQLTSSSNPVLMTIQICAPNRATTFTVAQALASELTENHGFDDVIHSDTDLPSGCDIVIPQDQEDYNAALRTLYKMDLHPWRASEIEKKGRLRYLTDLQSASAAFRFPIALNSGLPGITISTPLPGFDVGIQNNVTQPSHISIGRFSDRGGRVDFSPENISRHVLVAGTTGSGKTVTCMQLLGELWAKDIPFLVIEPISTQYRSLLKDSDLKLSQVLQVFTLGNERIAPFRLNPFEVLPGISVESHISQLRICFEASLPTFGVLPMLIEDSLYNIYSRRGWQPSDIPDKIDKRDYPMLGEFYTEIVSVAQDKGWSGNTTQDILGAVSTRIGSLLRGSKGMMLNSRHSFPIDKLMSVPTILELDSLNDEERSLVMMLFLVFAREYSNVNRKNHQLAHVTLIEEAHRVMSNQANIVDRETRPDTRGMAVSMFSAMLSEIRSSGEGLIIAEQYPTRLSDDVIKNTNTKIIHRLPGDDDRDKVGKSINASAQQIDSLAILRQGEAAFFTQGMERPAFVEIDNYPELHHLPEKLTIDTETNVLTWKDQYAASFLPLSGCEFCRTKCEFRERVMPRAYQLRITQNFQKLNLTYFQKGAEGANWSGMAQEACEALQPIHLGHDINAVYCLVAHLADFHLTSRDWERLNGAHKLLNQ